MEPGIYHDLDESVYHADPCAAPSLSAGIIKTLLNDSPHHAWYAHPRLNPDFEREEKSTYDFGTVAHQVILGDTKKYEIISPNDYPAKNGNIPIGWTNDAIREKRDSVYAAGKTPLLPREFNEINRMASAAKTQLADHECNDAFIDGKSEVTLIWQESGVWCRCRIDYISANGKNFYDFKTTDQSANPERASRMIFNLGYDITSAFYKRGIRKVLGIENPNYRFVVQEKEKPYRLSVCALDPMADAIADRKIDAAIALWGECLKTGVWPGYPKRIAYVAMPGYLETAWLERENRESEAA